MEQATQALLAQLKDIHEPNTPNWWPPAPGWWLTAIVAGVLLFCLGRIFLRKRAIAQRKQLALGELKKIKGELKNHPTTWGHQRIAELIKQLALETFPAASVAALNPESWLGFLAQTSPDTPKQLAQIMANSQHASYQSDPSMVDEELIAACKAWITKNYPADD